jgi:hypothetical protein
MGAGRWDTGSYDAARAYRAAHGIDDFDHSARTRRLDPSNWKAAPGLDPYGKTREARDSAEHPSSTPIAVLFDVTGSMGIVPEIVQKRLPDLLGMLLRGGYVDDPQILVGGIGDAESDRVPLQIAQFESDNRIDEQLRQIFLEGGGGGQKSESYEVAAWFMRHRVVTDAWEKRGKKGYLFIIGDEMNKPYVKPRVLAEVLGVSTTERREIADLYPDLAERWHVYLVLPKLTSYWDDPEVEQHWRRLVGQGFLRLEDPDQVCDLIAVTIGLEEGSVDLDEGLADVAAAGRTGTAVGTALATYRPARTLARTRTLPEDLAT